jgi:hypothetical protein
LLGVIGLTKLSSEGGNPGLAGGAAFFFLRSSIAFISRAFSGVREGVFGARIFGDIKGLEPVLELVDGRPPLV